MNISWIEYKGKRILYSDYKGLDTKQMIDHIRVETDMILKEPKPILYIGNFTDTVIAPEFIKVGNDLGKLTKKNIQKSALLGISGMKALIMNTFNMITGLQAKAFSDEAKAKEYLVN